MFPDDAREARVRSGSEHQRRRAVGVDGGRRGPGDLRAEPRRKRTGGCSRPRRRCCCSAAPPAHCHTYEALGINTARHRRRHARALGGARGVNVVESVTINRPIEELYRFWRNLENLPQFMHHLESVERVTDTLSRWRAKGPAGTIVEWNAEIINEVPNQVIGWRSIEGSDVVSAGSVNFDDAGPGAARACACSCSTARRAARSARRSRGCSGGTPRREIREDLRRFKQLVETGEVPTHARPAAGVRDA